MCRHFWFMELFTILSIYLVGAFSSLMILIILYHCDEPDERWPWHYAWLSWVFIIIWFVIVIKKLP